MITDRDIEKLKMVFATKADLNNSLKNYPTRNEMQQMGIDIISAIEKIFNDYAQRLANKVIKLEKRTDIVETKIEMSIGKISDLNMLKPIVIDHERRTWQLERKQTS